LQGAWPGALNEGEDLGEEAVDIEVVEEGGIEERSGCLRLDLCVPGSCACFGCWNFIHIGTELWELIAGNLSNTPLWISPESSKRQEGPCHESAPPSLTNQLSTRATLQCQCRKPAGSAGCLGNGEDVCRRAGETWLRVCCNRRCTRSRRARQEHEPCPLYT